MISFIAAMIAGCGFEIVRKNKSDDNSGTIPPIIAYQLKAVADEKNDDSQSALESWRHADVLMSKKIAVLTEKIGSNAEKHYQKGIDYLKEGRDEKAVVEFLTTLRYDRNHKGAVNSLKNSVQPFRNIAYAVKEGDTPQSIASQIYKNPGDDFIVRYFSGIGSDKDLPPGTVIKLPNLEVDFTKRFFNYTKEINIARKFYKDKEFRRVITCAENIINHMPDSEEAVYMINMAYYGLSDQYINSEDYSSAVEMLKQVDPKFRNVKGRIAYIEKLQSRRHTLATEKINKENYRTGKAFYGKKQYTKSLAAFEKVDPDYLDVQKVITDLKNEMKKISELHYKKGVMYYLKEDLNDAVSEWRQSLALDPENVKIKKDLENALQLIKKIDKIK